VGIQDPDIFSSSLTLHSIEEMAEAYTKCILSSRPQKRYIIGGASFGGTIAVEIARKLLSYGYEIDRVLIFDGWAVYPKQLNDEKYFYDSMYRQQQEWLTKFNKINKKFFDFNHFFKVQMQRLHMLFNYEMKELAIQLNVFKAEEIMPVFEIINDPTNHWGYWAKNTTLHSVPGNHETMFSDNHATVLASQIKDAVASLNTKKPSLMLGQLTEPSE
jgi:thioesterase domain-containing protein